MFCATFKLWITYTAGQCLANICETGYNQFNEIVKVLQTLKNEVIQNILLNQYIPFPIVLQQNFIPNKG